MRAKAIETLAKAKNLSDDDIEYNAMCIATSSDKDLIYIIDRIEALNEQIAENKVQTLINSFSA